MKASFKIEGLAELDRAFGELKQTTAKGVLRRTGRQALEPFDAAWRSRAPVEEGGLKESGGIGSKLSRSQRKAHERESFVEVFAGPGPHPKAVQQEFGNRNHAPHPFVRPAWEQTRGEVLDRVKTGLAEELRKTAERAARKAARLARKGGG